MRSLTECLAVAVAETPFERLPERTVASARRAVLDVLGCVLAGAREPECDLLVELCAPLGGMPAATVVGRPARLAAPWAALVNATAGRALDLDELPEPGQAHATVAVVPAALAVAESLDRPVGGREFIAAIVMAIDLLARLSIAPHRDSNATGLSHSYHAGVFAAAAVTARLLGAGVEGVWNSLGLALGLASGTRQPNLEGSPAVRVQQGWAAHAGVMAGLMAARGVHGPREVFEGHAGYFNAYHRGEYAAARLTEGLGERFAVDELTVKFYPACRYAHGAIHGILALRAEHALDAGDVRAVRVRVPRESWHAVCEPGDAKRAPATVPAALFSLPWLTAAALVRGCLTPAELSASGLADDEVRAWARRIDMAPDESLASSGAIGAAAVELELETGGRVGCTVTAMEGDPTCPATFERVERKMRELAAAALRAGAIDVDGLVERVRGLDCLDDVRPLARMLAGGGSALGLRRMRKEQHGQQGRARSGAGHRRKR